MAADGLDTAYGKVEEGHWRAFVRAASDRLGIDGTTTVFEFGCGAGAFLFDLYERGIAVGGLDQSDALITAAREAMPEGQFFVSDATVPDVAVEADVVVSVGLFPYLRSLEDATQVVESMVSCARKAVGIFDVPDLRLRDLAMRERVAALGGPEAYAARYAGLDHLYVDRDWLGAALARAGLVDIWVGDQEIEGYANARHRFNALGFKNA